MIDLILFIVCLHTGLRPEELSAKPLNHLLAKRLFTLVARYNGFNNSLIADTLGMTHGNITGYYSKATVASKIDDGFKRKLKEILEDIEESKDLVKEYQRIAYAKRVRSF